jgi:hypothetical protein
MFELPVTPARAGVTHQTELLLNRVPAGEYVLELRAAQEPATRTLIALRVR